MYPRGYSAAPPNPAYLPPAHYYAYPVPAAAPTPPGPMDNYSPPCMPFPAQAPPSPRQQRVKAYAQQHDKVLCFLHLSPAEFARRTHTLLTNLGYPDTSGTSQRLCKAPWALTITYRTSSVHWSKKSTPAPNPHPFKDPLDPAHSFHVQCEEPIRTRNEALPSVPHQQEELNVASSILRNLNPMGGLFNQPAAHTLALSACPWANSIPSAFQTWDQPAISEPRSQWPPPHVDNDNWTLSYIKKPGNPTNKHAPCNGPPQDQPPHFDLRAPCVNAPPPHPNAPVPP
ncbi:hypothetical protein E4T56_gene10973 [Termitomyces sp. T112]|nr:hypothetical protein E4T56_gene10973 [Termitomyces sp. T112]